MKLEDLDENQFLRNPKKDSEVNSLLNIHEDFNIPLKSGIKTLKTTILRFIILLYDMNTPLRIEYPNFYKRKMNAALMAGFQRNAKTKKFSNSVTEILKGENGDVNKAIIRYVMQFFDMDYLMFIMWYEILGNRSIELMNMGDRPLSNTHIEAIKSVRKEINILEEKIFGGQESKELEKKLYRSLEIEKEALYPDYVAKMLDEKGSENLFRENDDESIE